MRGALGVERTSTRAAGIAQKKARKSGDLRAMSDLKKLSGRTSV
jgi:hypothetical protein